MEGDEVKVNGEENKDFGSSSLLSNPGDSLDLLTCHSCGIRGSDLQTLDSQWRVVLLCHGCLAGIRSAAVCSYCFRRLIARVFDVLICSSCSCRVHLHCIAVQRGCITLSELDPVSFACVDCCAIPKRVFRNPSRVSPSRLSRDLLENLARNVRSAAEQTATLAARARVKALKKAEEARVAMEAAFDQILFARDAAVADDKMALQLHRVMNGTRRILRRVKLSDLDHATTLKKICGAGSDNLMHRKLRKHRGSARERIDRIFFESKNCSLPKRCSFIKLGIGKEKEASEFDAHYASGSREVNWDEKKTRHFNLVVNCNGDANNDGLTLISCCESADSNSFMEASERGRGTGEDPPKQQKEKKGCNVHELHALKSCKRTSRLK